MDNERRAALVERVARIIAQGEYGDTVDDVWMNYTEEATAAIDLIRDQLREEAARVAEREGVYPELNIAAGGPEWYRHGKRIVAAIRALKEKP